jgi:LPXTG-motif cell wall-anchored protein
VAQPTERVPTMGTANYTRECGPDGNTIVHITATNGWTTVYVDGAVIHDTNNDGLVDTTTGPGVHQIEWWGPSSHDLNFLVLLNEPTILDIPALTNCATAPTTTTAAPTTSEAPTESTALVPPSTIATITPQIDMDVDPCVTSTGCTTTVAVTGRLPETGRNDGELLLAGGSLVIVGTLAVLAVRRGRRVAS